MDVKKSTWHFCLGDKVFGVDSTRQIWAKNVTTLLDECGFYKKIIVYVKDEGANLNVLTMALKFVVSCEIFGLDESF